MQTLRIRVADIGTLRLVEKWLLVGVIQSEVVAITNEGMLQGTHIALLLVNMALPQAWFSEIGLIDLTKYDVAVLHLFAVTTSA